MLGDPGRPQQQFQRLRLAADQTQLPRRLGRDGPQPGVTPGEACRGRQKQSRGRAPHPGWPRLYLGRLTSSQHPCAINGPFSAPGAGRCL
ncbi:hypothetical protein HMPREF0731_0298 [Pseudoroseomonas cervicalis ATCC 49957]|uniref:Uncharacterized protein n=1 Tax=Pseudoroseomonas cervicalis ATCC 49957 TaxID=525371 RepID=D5RGT9_9PROT|nr:hypothetical protein HMPREF0731_0298 [Pseudoroseomonas cervicalis ATCC 49957]